MITWSPDDSIVVRTSVAAVRKQPLAEHYEALWGRLNSVAGTPLRAVGLTSTYRGEGVTTVTANLAMAAAGARGAHTLLVDANLRASALHRFFGKLRGPGLSEAVSGKCDWKESVQPLAKAGLSLLPAGITVGEFTATTDIARCHDLLHELGEHFDLIIVDLPAVGDGGMALPLSAALDGVALVVEAERVPWEDARRSTQLLSQAEARLLGAVLNKKPDRTPHWLRRR